MTASDTPAPPTLDPQAVEALAALFAKKSYLSPPRRLEDYGTMITCREAFDAAATLRALLSETKRLRAEVAAAREGALREGWNACRKSVYAVCENVAAENERHVEDTENEVRYHFGRGGRAAAKSIARGFSAMEADDDDNFRAALAAYARAGTQGAGPERSTEQEQP